MWINAMMEKDATKGDGGKDGFDGRMKMTVDNNKNYNINVNDN